MKDKISFREKLAIEEEKSAIGGEKLAIDMIKSAIEQQKYSEPTKANILKAYNQIENNQGEKYVNFSNFRHNHI